MNGEGLKSPRLNCLHRRVRTGVGCAPYDKLEGQVLPLYYQHTRWTWMMKQGMSKIGSYFNSRRMRRRDTSVAYVRVREGLTEG